MSSLTWQEHFKDRLEGLEGSSDSSLLELAILDGRFTEEEYLQWVSETFTIPVLESRFFAESSPISELLEKAKLPWGPSFFPVSEWEGVLLVAGFELKKDLPENVVFILAHKSAMASWWEQFGVSEEATDIPDILKEASSPPPSFTFTGVTLGRKEDNVQEKTLVLEEIQPPPTSDQESTLSVTVPLAPVSPGPSLSFAGISVLKSKGDEAPAVPVAAVAPEVPPKATEKANSILQPLQPLQSAVAKAEPPPLPVNLDVMEELTPIPIAKEKSSLLSPNATGSAAAPNPTESSVSPATAVTQTKTTSAATSTRTMSIPSGPVSVLLNPKIGEFTLKKTIGGMANFPKDLGRAFGETAQVLPHAMFLVLSEAGDNFIPYGWTSAFAQPTVAKMIPLNLPSPFRIVFSTDKPFHGPVSPCDVFKLFTTNFPGATPSEHLTLTPVFVKNRLIAVVLGMGQKPENSMATLRLFEKVARDLSNLLGQQLDANKVA